MDIAGILVELREERARFDKAIKALEALQDLRRDSGKRATRTRKLRSSQNHNRIAPVARNLAEVIPIRSYGS